MKMINPDDPFVMVRHRSIFFPAPLKPGDKIALLSPASTVKEEYVLAAMDRILEYGYEPVLMPHALGPADGSFSSTKSDRNLDLIDALTDDEYKAILCTRGGYGCTQLLQNYSYGVIAGNPKWLIGFSDVSVLLALWYRSDVASIHGPMAKHLATKPKDDFCTKSLFDMLANGGRFDYTVAPHEYNVTAKVSGVLRGGNLAVLNDLANTPVDLLDAKGDKEDIILFLEDIAEPIYKINRMLWRLQQSFFLPQVKAVIFGQFTDYKPDKNYNTMEDMIHDFFSKTFMLGRIPVVYDFPIGHGDVNLPLTEGAKVELEITDKDVRLHTIF